MSDTSTSGGLQSVLLARPPHDVLLLRFAPSNNAAGTPEVAIYLAAVCAISLICILLSRETYRGSLTEEGN